MNNVTPMPPAVVAGDGMVGAIGGLGSLRVALR